MQKAPDSTTVPLCTVCHRAVTDTYAAPGLSRAETEQLCTRVALRLVSDWLARWPVVSVPLLRLVAAAALLALGVSYA